MQVVLSTICLLFFSIGIGQNSPNSVSKSVSIKSNFSTEEIFAYQASANLKVNDFYDYLTLFSKTDTSVDLKKEIKRNLFRLTNNEHFFIIDFFSKSINSIEIDTFLSKIDNKNYKFLVSDINNSNIEFQSWSCTYKLKIVLSNDSIEKTINQKIIFSPIEKSFGNQQKLVWNIFLGSFIE